MNFLIKLIIFALGLTIGSFLNCVIYRMEEGKSFLRGHSFCPHCKHVLEWRDLIPVFSFLILKGKCRYCHQKISWQYPLVELSTAFIFLFIFLTSPSNIYTMVYLLLISCFFIVIFVYDLKHYIIPDKVIHPAIFLALIYNLINYPTFLKNLLAAVGAGAFFFFIFLISQGKWMGFGDGKLAFLMSLFLGFPNILTALFLAFFIGAIIGITLIILKRKKFKSEVPFAPFLVIGTFIALFLGNQILSFYLKFFKF